MGSRHGGRQRRDEESDDDGPVDYAALLSFLLRNGQIRLLSSTRDVDLGDDEDDEDVNIPCCPETDLKPDTKRIHDSDFKQVMLFRAGERHTERVPKKYPVSHMLAKRKLGYCANHGFSTTERAQISACYLPNTSELTECFSSKVFCGTYSRDGSVFLSACQDQFIRLYNTTKGRFKKFREIRAQDIGWSILDTAFSPDGCYLIYSSWSENIHICNIYGDYETHMALDLQPGHIQFCAFSIQFSGDNKEILVGANDGCLYIYDREKNQRTLRVDGHHDDVNAICFADETSQILFSGGDDGLCHVWDRRMLSDTNTAPVGSFAGHCDGITFIDTKGDARHLITNSKDQSIKLWDLRKFSSEEAIENTKRAVSMQEWDYRWQRVPRRSRRKSYVKGDTSLMTYRGHGVLHTLLRARFSPQFSTDQRYIYAACATGSLVIYDSLTGEVVRKCQQGHDNCVRDVSWHPYENNIISSSWDGTHRTWEYRGDADDDSDPSDSDTDSEDSDKDVFSPVRRSRRLEEKRKQRRHRRLQRRPKQSV